MSSVCRVCLAGNMTLKSLKNKLLVDLYEKLSTTKFNSEDARPKALCSSCYQKLLRCHTFSQMAHRSEKILSHLFHEGLEATQANITKMTMNDCHSSGVTMLCTIIDGETTNAGSQITIKDEPISSIDIKEEVTTENDKLVEIEYAQDCIQSEFILKDKSDRGNEMEELPFIIKVEQTKQDSSRSLMEPSSFNECEEQFNQNGHLVERMRIHTRKKSFACNVCDKRFLHKSSLSFHMKSHTGEKPFACNVCDKQFDLKLCLVKHTKIHAREKPFVCNVCYKQFNRKSHIIRHMRIHTGEKPFVCKVCDKQFTQKSSLDFHTKIHTGEKPFACSVCGKQYNRKYYLVEHLRLHTGERPFVCNVCDKQFNRKNHLIGHMRIHTGEKPFACNVCNKKFNRKSSLVEHMRTHTGVKLFHSKIYDKESRNHKGEKPPHHKHNSLH